MWISIVDKRTNDKQPLGELVEKHIVHYKGIVTISMDLSNGFEVEIRADEAEVLDFSKALCEVYDMLEVEKKAYHTCPKCGEYLPGNNKVDHFLSMHPEYKFTESRPYAHSSQKVYRCDGCGLTFGSFKILVEKHTKCIGGIYGK